MHKVRFILSFLLTNILFTFADDTLVVNINQIKPTVGLVLSGGGARGFSQIGVLKVLTENNILPNYIAGTSIGALVGGLYAVGYTPQEMEDIAISTRWNDIISAKFEELRENYFLDQKIIKDKTLFSIRFNKFQPVFPKSIWVGWKFTAFIQKLIWSGAFYSKNFNDLKVPFRAVATNIINGETVVLSRGNLVTALKASSAIPLLYTPIEIDSLVLVDGGLFANIPVFTMNEFDPDVILAVNTTSPLLKKRELNNPLSIANQVISILMNVSQIDAKRPPDFVITPKLANYPNDDFSQVDSLIYKGEEITNEILPSILRFIDQKKNEKINSLEKEIKKLFNIDTSLFLFVSLPSTEPSIENKIYSFSMLSNFPTANQGKFISFECFVKMLDSNGIESFKVFRSQEADSLNHLQIEIPTRRKILGFTLQSSIKGFSNQFDSLINMFIGRMLNSKTIEEVYSTFRKFLAQRGYSFAKVSISETEPGILAISIQPMIISNIVLKHIKSSQFLVTRELTFREGDPLNVDKIISSWQNLMGTDLFSDLQIDLELDEINSTAEIIISLNEIGTQIFNVSTRIDNFKNLHGGLNFQHINLFNSGFNLFTSAYLSSNDFLFEFNLSQPRLFTSDFSFFIGYHYYKWNVNNFGRKTGLPRTEYQTFVVDNTINEENELFARFGSNLEKFGYLFIDLRYATQRYYKDSDTVLPNFYQIFTNRFGLIFNSLNNPDFPTSGRLISLGLEIPFFLAGKNFVKYTKAYFDHISNFSIGDLTIRPSVSFGFADRSLPFPEYFVLDGDAVFPGTYEDEFQGKQIFLGKLEIQNRIPLKFYFDTFLTLSYSIGSTWGDFEVIRIGELKHSIQFSIGFDTPIGPARFSVARLFFYLKEPNAVAWGPVRTYFSIGSQLFP